jgi:hypothetical protein
MASILQKFFGGARPQWDSPAVGGAAPTLSDTVDDPAGPFRSLWVGVAGNIKVGMADGSSATFANVPVGILPVTAVRVYATGTTATSLVGLL